MTFEELGLYANRFGLEALLSSRTSDTGDLFVIVVQRPPEAGTWSMPPTEIGFAKDVITAIKQAKLALDRMKPRLEKELAKLPHEESESLALSAGVSSDGTVTTLRVERDGTIRLAREDIEAIAEAVVRRLQEPKP